MKIAEYKARLEDAYMKAKAGECSMDEALRLSEKLDQLLLQVTPENQSETDL